MFFHGALFYGESFVKKNPLGDLPQGIIALKSDLLTAFCVKNARHTSSMPALFSLPAANISSF